MKRNQFYKKHQIETEHSADSAGNNKSFVADPFIIPDGYFDGLPNKVIERIVRKEKSPDLLTTTLSIINNALIPLALAASVAFLVLLRQPFTPDRNKTTSNSPVVSTHSTDYDPVYSDEVLLIEEAKITNEEESQIDLKLMSNSLFKSDTTAISADEKIQFLLNENYDTEIIADL